MKRFKNLFICFVFILTLILLYFSCKNEDATVFYIEPNIIEFGAEGGSKEVTITCNSDWNISYTTDWCAAALNKGTGNAVVSFSAQANDNSSERTANIIFTAGNNTQELTVSQKGNQSIFFNLSSDTIEFDLEGGDSEIYVNCDINWDITNTTDWISESIKALDSIDIVTLTVQPNADTLARSAKLYFTAGNITKELVVNQQGYYLTVLNNNAEFGAFGGEESIEIISNMEWSITYSSNWCEVSEDNNGSKSIIKIITSSNISIDGNAKDRTTAIAIKSDLLTRYIKVVQTGLAFEQPPDNTDMRELTCIELSEEMGVGWNVGNSLEATGGETSWGNPLISQRLIDSVKNAGFNSVRIPVAWSSHFSDNSTFTIETSFLERVEEVVNYVLNNKMYAIINIHWDGGWMQPTYDDQEYVNNRLAKMWKQIATHFRDYNDYLLFAGTNEVHIEGDYGAPSRENYTIQNKFNQLFIETVRVTGGRNLYRHLVIQGYNTNIDHTVSFNTIPTDIVEDHIMMEVHYYDPYNFTLNENSNITQWGANAEESKTAGWGNENYADNQFDKMKTHFIDKGVAVILGEYGAIYRSEESEPYRKYFNEYITKSMMQNGLVPFYWDNGYTGNYGFGLFNRSTGEQVYPDIVNAIVSAVN